MRLFAVSDAASKAHVGHFYLDLHPRTGKYNHAAIFHLVKGRANGHGAVDCMLCNLPQPEADSPALLRHGDVVTFFHEFGHIMHGLCAEGDANSTRRVAAAAAAAPLPRGSRPWPSPTAPRVSVASPLTRVSRPRSS